MLFLLLFEHYLSIQGIPTNPAIHYIALFLFSGAAFYLLGSVGRSILPTD